MSQNNLKPNLNPLNNFKYTDLSNDCSIACMTIYSSIRDHNNIIIDFLIEYVNSATCKHNNMIKEEHIGNRMLELFPHYKENGLFNEFCKVVETDEPLLKYSYPYNCNNKASNQLCTTNIRAVKLNDGFVVILNEVHDYATNNSVKENTDEIYKLAFETASIGLAIVSINGKTLNVNNALCEMLGYSEAELLKISFHEILYLQDFDSMVNIYNQILENKIKHFYTKIRLIHKFGHIISVILNTSLVRDKKNVPLYFTSQFQETSKIENINDSNESIDAEKINTEFFSNLSHELRTPTSTILSSLQLVSFYTDNNLIQRDTLTKHLDIMNQNCLRLVRLTNNLMDMTRMDTGFFYLDFKNWDIVKLIKNTALTVLNFLSDTNICINFNSNIDSKIIACDPDQMERIILNLLSNAVKFSKVPIKIDVNVRVDDNHIIIIVEDNGIGIKDEDIHIIFNRFKQVDKSLIRNHEGTGIGLSLVKFLIELHDGTINAESKFQHFSKFIIKLPCRLLDNMDIDNLTNQQILNFSDKLIERVNVEFSDIYLGNFKK